jgi:proteasome lid subunit RPN8/RPN11
MDPRPALLIPSNLLSAVIEHCRAEAPREACGLLAGTEPPRVTTHYPLRNELASETRYRGDSRDTIAAVLAMRDRGERLLAIYHSHPASPAVPSRHDLEGNGYGPVPHLIVSLSGGGPSVRAWRLDPASFRELAWNEVVESETLTS